MKEKGGPWVAFFMLETQELMKVFSMKKEKLKPVLIGMLMLWLLFFTIDSVVEIHWPNYTVHQMFTWMPTVLIAIYWMLFGGDKSDKP